MLLRVDGTKVRSRGTLPRDVHPGHCNGVGILHLVQLQADRDLELERRISVGQNSDEYEPGLPVSVHEGSV